MRQPLVEHRPLVAGVRTRALELEGSGPPLVLLHGFADSGDTWRLVLDRLARRGRRAIAYDLPGFGAADPRKPDEGVLEQLGTFAHAVIRTAAGEAGEPAIVVGNSLGGCVALRAGERGHALPLKGIVPIAPAGLDMPRWFAAIERDPIVRGLLASPIPLPPQAVQAVVGEAYRRFAFSSRALASADVVASFGAHLASRLDLVRTLDNGRRMLPELADPFRLDEVEVPTLLVWGDRDRMVPHTGAQRVLAAMPHTEYELLTGVGHCPQVEAPDALVALLERFAAAEPRADAA